jgi:glycosyltransferase involved in cell wall biosynthesis
MHVLAPARFGGLERVVTTLATGQHSRGHRVYAVLFVAANGQDSNLARELRDAGIAVYEIISGDRDYVGKFNAFKAHIAQTKPDVVHTHGYVADVFASMLDRSARTFAKVSTVHGFTGGGWKNRLYERIQRRAFRRFDAVVAVSRPIAATLIASGCSEARVHTVTNAWSPTEPPLDVKSARNALGLTADAFNVGWVGRISHEKGLDVLVEALPALADLRLRLTVIGDGNAKADVQRRAEQIGVASRIHWAGIVDNASRLLRAFDVLAISSRTEGTPIILLEAIGAGVPVITAAVGGIPDVVTADEALLVPPADPAALATGLRAIYSDPQSAATRAARARERVQSLLAVEPWVEAYSGVYGAARRARDLDGGVHRFDPPAEARKS